MEVAIREDVLVMWVGLAQTVIKVYIIIIHVPPSPGLSLSIIYVHNIGYSFQIEILQFAALCEPECQNGVCLSPGICSCSSGWGGFRCDRAECSPSCLYGDCTGPNQCTCQQGWGGQYCEQGTYSICLPNIRTII